MKKILSFLLILIIYSCDDNSTDPESDEGSTTELEGTWIGYEVDGAEGTWTFIATENEMDISYDGEYELVGATTFTLDTESTPKEINITILTYILDGDPYTGYDNQISLGIYKIENANLLTTAANEPGSEVRPTDYNPDGDSRVFILTKQ